MRRFFLKPEAFAGDRVVITGDLFRHMVKVLRLTVGDKIILADGTGVEFVSAIEEVVNESLFATLLEKNAETATAGPRITLFQGLPKSDKLELILQKTTELGVSEVVPFTAARSITRLRKGEETAKVIRWQRIAMEAARQSGRACVPAVQLAGDLKDALKLANHPVKLLLWEEEKVMRLREALSGLPLPESVAVLVGPEGGLSKEEAAAARASGFLPVTLGDRILRTETAGMVAVSLVQFYWGDLG